MLYSHVACSFFMLGMMFYTTRNAPDVSVKARSYENWRERVLERALEQGDVTFVALMPNDEHPVFDIYLNAGRYSYATHTYSLLRLFQIQIPRFAMPVENSAGNHGDPAL